MKKGIHDNLPCGDDVHGAPMRESDAGKAGGDFGRGESISGTDLDRGYSKSDPRTLIHPADWTDRYYAPF